MVSLRRKRRADDTLVALAALVGGWRMDEARQVVERMQAFGCSPGVLALNVMRAGMAGVSGRVVCDAIQAALDGHEMGVIRDGDEAFIVSVGKVG